MFVDGRLVTQRARAGAITTNRHPLYVGADPDRRGNPNSFFRGSIDEVRLSTVARYEHNFTPARRHQRDDRTILLLHFDTEIHGIFPDDSGAAHHAWSIGNPKLGPRGRESFRGNDP